MVKTESSDIIMAMISTILQIQERTNVQFCTNMEKIQLVVTICISGLQTKISTGFLYPLLIAKPTNASRKRSLPCASFSMISINIETQYDSD